VDNNGDVVCFFHKLSLDNSDAGGRGREGGRMQWSTCGCTSGWEQPLLHAAVQRLAAGRDLQQRGDEQLQVPASRVTLAAADGGGGLGVRVAAGVGVGKAAGAKRQRGGAAHA
jgi:hypothetical protein